MKARNNLKKKEKDKKEKERTSQKKSSKKVFKRALKTIADNLHYVNC